MRVNDRRKFHGVFSVPQTNHKAIVHGRFKHHNRKVVGTLRLKGNFSGGCIDADTGLLGWVRPPRRRLGGAPLSARDDYLVVSLDARGSCLLEAPSKLR
jgi:hypothetical protein